MEHRAWLLLLSDIRNAGKKKRAALHVVKGETMQIGKSYAVNDDLHFISVCDNMDALHVVTS